MYPCSSCHGRRGGYLTKAFSCIFGPQHIVEEERSRGTLRPMVDMLGLFPATLELRLTVVLLCIAIGLVCKLALLVVQGIRT